MKQTKDMILLQIDYREKELISQIQLLLTHFPSFTNVFASEVVNLPIGDIWIVTEGKTTVIIERKTIADLMASIKDGRYDEQSLRLNAAIDVPNHNIVYLIEGDATRFQAFKDSKQKMTFYSALTSMAFYKGFSVLRSMNVEETALLLCQMASKIHKCTEEGKSFFYRNGKDDKREKEGGTEEEVGDIGQETHYSHVIKTVKKDNITPDNIGVIMLNQIPGISHVTSAEIMGQYKTLKNLLSSLEADPSCLDHLSLPGKQGKVRKVSKTVTTNIRRFLLAEEEG